MISCLQEREMYRSARNPALQLNSKAIKDAASCFLTPILGLQPRDKTAMLVVNTKENFLLNLHQNRVHFPAERNAFVLDHQHGRRDVTCKPAIVRNRLSVVTAQCVWRVQRKDLSEVWKLVCKKREECNQALMTLPGLEFFFSAIGVKEITKKAKEKDENESDDVGEESGVQESSQISQASERSFAMAAEKKRFPSFSFWMGFTSSTRAPVSLLPIEKVLLSCEVEINVQIQKTAEKSIMPLFPVLKDHNSSYVTELVEASFQATIADTANQLSCQSLLSSPMNCSKEKVVFFTMKSTASKKNQITNALGAMKKAGLRVDVLDAESNGMVRTITTDKSITSDPKVLLFGNLERAMESLEYKLYRGSMYKKVKESKYTYRYKCSVADWLVRP